MITIKLTPKTRTFALKSAIKVLERGGVIAFATETVYGIGCDPRRASAITKMVKIKGRDEKKPFQLIAGSVAQVKEIADLNPFEKKIAAKYWPGPLTLLVDLKRGERLPSNIAPKRIIGIRVTPDPFLRDLASALGFPIAATSANRSGDPPATSGQGVLRAFRESHESRLPRAKPRGATSHKLNKNSLNAPEVSLGAGARQTPNAFSAPALLIDAGRLPKRKPSTVARVGEDGRVEIVRRGGVRLAGRFVSS